MIGKQLPESKVYEKGLLFWPYRASQQLVLDKIAELAPHGGCLLDIMCGPGNLLGRIVAIRPDLKLVGVDKKPQYTQYISKKYPEIISIWGDVLHWHPASPFDIVVCTGALHHLLYNLQENAIDNPLSARYSTKSKNISIFIDYNQSSTYPIQGETNEKSS